MPFKPTVLAPLPDDTTPKDVPEPQRGGIELRPRRNDDMVIELLTRIITLEKRVELLEDRERGHRE